jgi:putative transposase
VKFFKSCEVVGKPRNVTVKREVTGWFVSIQVEQEVAEPVHSSTSMVGIDRGIAKLAMLSDGSSYQSRHSYRALEEKLAKAQRQLKRKTKFSSNWKKQQSRIGQIHHKIANCRKDRLHWIANDISKNHAIVVLEDLKVVNMSKSAKGDLENPGKNVKAKSGLNKSILDQGWSMFAGMLEYKQKWRGGEVFYVSPHHTSQTCPKCQHREKANRKSQAEFACKACGYTNNADWVGAINILARGHRVLACGEPALAGSVKQEPKAA